MRAEDVAGATKRARKKRGTKSKNNKASNGAGTDHGAAPDKYATEVEIVRLASLHPFDYQRQRNAGAKALGFSVRYLDNLVDSEREKRTAGSGEWPEIEPWPDEVDGAALLDELAAAIKRYVGVPTRGEEAVALWILHTHCFDAAETSPRLAITSPSPECGKSTLLWIVGDLVPRKLIAANITTAATYHAVEKFRPTLLIDEADTFLKNNDELRGVLNSGHSRDGYVWRMGGEDRQELRRFSTWCPLVVAMIGKLPATLASRAIHIELQRLSQGESVEPYHQRKAPNADLARRCARWAEDNLQPLCDAEPDMKGLANRRADNWRPLFAIADRAGGHWPNLAREVALTLNHVDAGQTTAIMLLEDMRAAIGTADRISSATLAGALAKLEGRPWPEFGRQRKPITPNAIARMLKPFNITPDDMRDPDDGSSCKGYWASALQSVFERYLAP